MCTTDSRPSLPARDTCVEDNARPEMSLITPTFTATINMIFATNIAPHHAHSLAPSCPLLPSSAVYAQLDDGANISGTPNISLLTDVTLLAEPLTISAADKREVSPMTVSYTHLTLPTICSV